MTPEYRNALNLAAAQLCGWSDFWEKEDWPVMAFSPAEQRAGIEAERSPIPDFCRDKNALDALLEAVERFGEPTVQIFVRACFGYQTQSYLRAFDLLRLPAAEITRCALLATNFWTPELAALYLAEQEKKPTGN